MESKQGWVWRNKKRRWVKKGSVTYAQMVENGEPLLRHKENKHRSPATRQEYATVPWEERRVLQFTRPVAESLAEEEEMEKPHGRTFIEKHGKQLLKSEGKVHGQRTRGWSLDVPRSSKERKALYEACDKKGKPCFLGPVGEGPRGGFHATFPICRRPVPGEKITCEIDPRSLPSALIRAEQYGYEGVAQESRHLMNLYGVPKEVAPKRGTKSRRHYRETYDSSGGETKEEKEHKEKNKEKKLGAEEYEMLYLTNDEKEEAYQRFSRLVHLPENNPRPGWADEELLPKSKSEQTIAFLDRNLIGAYFQTTTDSKRKAVSLDLVNVHPLRMGKGLCKPFTKRVIQYFMDAGYTDFDIGVHSSTKSSAEGEEGVPACLCYYRAAAELGLEIYYYNSAHVLTPLPTQERCLRRATNQMDLHFRRPPATPAATTRPNYSKRRR